MSFMEEETRLRLNQRLSDLENRVKKLEFRLNNPDPPPEKISRCQCGNQKDPNKLLCKICILTSPLSIL
jgi:hypothetical protein